MLGYIGLLHDGKGGCSSTESGQGEEDVHTRKQQRVENMSLCKVRRASKQVGGSGISGITKGVRAQAE